MTNKLNVRMLCEGAVFIAIALILGQLRLYEFPNGGSISLEMLPMFIFITRWGFRNGLVGCFAFGVLQIFVEGAISWGWVSMILDFILAFGVMGLGGLFKGKIYPASVVAAVARFIVHFISGITVYRILVPTELFNLTFTNPWIYSLAYNGSYIVVDLVLCLIVITALMASPVMRRLLQGEDLKKG